MPAPGRNRLLFGSSFSPASIAGLKLWLDASRITGLVDGDPVGTWSDLSGLGNHATQATASKKPTYKVNIQNGRPVVRGDGVDDILAAPAISLTSPDYTIALVAIKSGTTGAYAGADISGSRGWVFRPPNFETNGAAATTYTSANGANALIAVGGDSIYVNGTNAGSISARTMVPSTAGVGIFGRTFVGAETYFPGDIAEVLVYAVALNVGQRMALQAYLKVKWGLP